ncbi:MAG: polyamine ABC transporter substrate-binding protein [Steroidobacteraceae bacterium]
MSLNLRYLTAFAALAALAACAKKAETPEAAVEKAPAAVSTPGQMDDEKVLNVYNWVDYVDKSILEDFTKETGIKVNYDTFDGNELLTAKLLSGNTGYDVVVPSASFLEKQIQAGVFQKLDKALIPNLTNLDPAISAITAKHDRDNAHSVPYFWGTSGIGFNEQQIAKAMPNAPTDSFAMFYDPNVVRNFQKCGVTILDAPDEVVATVLIYLGKDAMSEKQEDLAAAEKVLMAIRPYVKEIKSAGYLDDLAAGEICLAMGWSGDVGMAATRAEENKKKFTITYHIPKEGAVMFFDMLAVPKDARHPKNAHLFIDYLLRKEVAAKNTNFVTYASPNKAAYDLIDKEIIGNPHIYPTAEVQKHMYPNLARSADFTRNLNRTWTRFKTGK